MSMKDHFERLADYNAWANRRLYESAATLPEGAWRREVGVFFGTLEGTLNHILLTDRIWMRRLTGRGTHPAKLGVLLYPTFAELREGREAEDERILAFARTLTDRELEVEIEYVALSGQPHRQRRRDVLSHLFNHQTHHRGIAHAVLAILGVREPKPLDLLSRQRETVAMRAAPAGARIEYRAIDAE